MPSQATKPTLGGGIWRDGGTSASKTGGDLYAVTACCRTLYAEAQAAGLSVSTRPDQADPDFEEMEECRAFLSTLSGALALAGGDSFSVPPTGAFFVRFPSLVQAARDAVDAMGAYLDNGGGDPGGEGSGILTIELYGQGASICSGSAETDDGRNDDGDDWSDGYSYADPAADVAVWLDEAGFGPVNDPHCGTGVRRKQGSWWPQITSLLSLGYVSPGGQPVRVRLFAFAKGSSLLHVDEFESPPPDSTRSLGYGDTSSPDGLWAYAVEQQAAFQAAVVAEDGYDARYHKRISLSSFGNEAEWITASPDPADEREITQAALTARFAAIPDDMIEVFGGSFDAHFLLPTGGTPADVDTPILFPQRDAEFDGMEDARGNGHEFWPASDHLRTLVQAQAADNSYPRAIEDSVHPSKYGYNLLAPQMVAAIADKLGLTPA